MGGLFPWAFRGRRRSAGDSTGRSTAHKSRHHNRHRPQGGPGRRSPAGTAGGLLRHRRSGQGRQTATRSGTGCRTAAQACRIAAPKGFTRTVSSLYPVYQRPPYSPPRTLQALPCNPAKPPPQRPPAGRSRGKRHRTADRHPYSTGTASSLQHSQHTGPQPHTAQPAATNQRARARFKPNAQAHEPKRARTRESKRARVRVGTPGRSSTSAGAEAQNIFRCVSIFFTSPGPGRKNKRGVKKKNWRPLEGRQKIF